jgi:hypothetical protein
VHKCFSIAARVAYFADMYLKIKTVFFFQNGIPEMHSFSMRPAKNFYDKPLPKYLDPKTVLIYRPHPVQKVMQFNIQTKAFIPLLRLSILPQA